MVASTKPSAGSVALNGKLLRDDLRPSANLPIQIIGISLYITGTAALSKISKLRYRYIVYSCTGERFKMAKWPNPPNRGGQATGGRNWVSTDLKGSGWSVGENLGEDFFLFSKKHFFKYFAASNACCAKGMAFTKTTRVVRGDQLAKKEKNPPRDLEGGFITVFISHSKCFSTKTSADSKNCF